MFMCAEIKSAPSVTYITSSGRVWRKVPEKMLGFSCTTHPSQDSARICVVTGVMCMVTGVLRQGHLQVYYVKATSVMMCVVTGVLRQGHLSHDECGHRCLTSRPPQS